MCSLPEPWALQPVSLGSVHQSLLKLCQVSPAVQALCVDPPFRSRQPAVKGSIAQAAAIITGLTSC